MDHFVQYSIPLQGIGNGIHDYQFSIGNAFFNKFEDSLIKQGSFKVELTLDKRDDMLVLDFDVTGYLNTTCDRCTANIKLPISRFDQIIVKYRDEATADTEIVYISSKAPELNVANMIHEVICLSIPIQHLYECEEDENPPCNQDILDQLEGREESGTEIDNPFKKILKNFKREE